MIWFLVMVVIIICVLLLVKWNNFYGMIFAFGFLVIEILTFVIILSVAKFATYSFRTSLEYHIYQLVLKIRINYHDLKRITNCAVWLFCMVMLLVSWKNSINTHRLRNILVNSGLVILSGFWILLLDSVRIHEMLYIAVHTGGKGTEILRTVLRTGDLLLILFYCLLSLWKIGHLIRITRFQVRRKYLFAVWISIGILIGIFWFIILSAPVKYFFWDYKANDFHDLYGFYKDSRMATGVIWLFLLIMGIVLLMVRFDILKEKSFVRYKWSYRNSLISINNLCHVFHSYKNAMFSIECMCEVALTEYGGKESEEAVKNILSCARSYYDQAGRFLDVYNRSERRWDRFQMGESVLTAKKRVGVTKGIEIIVHIETEDDFIYGDYEAFVEMLVNLINNSREAITKKEEKGEIRINVWSESMLVCMSIWDNGEGMDKKVMRNLYEPFFTTKKNFHNWGIGMSQIRKTVDSHQGMIHVESKPGKYTEFQIAVPMDV